MKHSSAWVHLHRKYSIYRLELNHAQQAGASGVCSCHSIELLPLTATVWRRHLAVSVSILYLLHTNTRKSKNTLCRQNEKAAVKCYPTYVRHLPTGKEEFLTFILNFFIRITFSHICDCEFRYLNVFIHVLNLTSHIQMCKLQGSFNVHKSSINICEEKSFKNHKWAKEWPAHFSPPKIYLKERKK